MINALDAFRMMQTETDKYESPSFSIRDFNQFYNTAIDELVDDRYSDGPDGKQSMHDDIKVLLSDPISLSFGQDNTTSLPEAYRNILELEVTIEMVEDKEKYRKGEKLVVYPRKKRSSRNGYVNKNAYQSSKIERAWYRLRGNTITVEIDPAAKIVDGNMEMIKVPDVVYLHPNYKNLSDDDKLLEANNTPIQFPVTTVRKINRICRRIILENIESNRYQSVVNENYLATK